MTLFTKSAEESDHKLSKKELAKQFRRDAYLRAKEYRKTDPRQIAMIEKMKEQRRDAYQQAKKRNKAYRDQLKKSLKEKSARKRIVKQDKLMKMVVPGSAIKGSAHESAGES
jgi:CRISPR/Cas system CSM-associated protein Csm5 (group 7 of RAMP superfamily)